MGVTVACCAMRVKSGVSVGATVGVTTGGLVPQAAKKLMTIMTNPMRPHMIVPFFFIVNALIGCTNARQAFGA